MEHDWICSDLLALFTADADGDAIYVFCAVCGTEHTVGLKTRCRSRAIARR